MTNTPADTYTDLKAKLREMFQMDQADLDFGIYRIMNAKRDEISDYLDNHLQPQVKEILQEVADGDGEKIAIRMGEIETAAKKFNADPNQDEEYKELLAQKSGLDQITALEREIFSDLYSFFARYYEGGDFLSLRRYKAGVYAIPYEGEEVKLHWANADQYYIKTSEYFANYAFTLGKKRVAFRLVSANTEQNNNKPAQGTHRRFVLADPPILPDADELVIAMEYRLFDAKTSQDDLWEDAIATLREMPALKPFGGLFDAIEPDKIYKKDETPTSVLQYHLKKYTARNSFDYFIHKDLGGFLKRELDFFIKNEVLFLDNFIGGAQEDIIARLAKVRALKAIADKIIKFLTGLEEFQKKLWLKKKFVVAADWCMTLDFVDEKFYSEIVANQAQHDAWVALFGIDGLTADLGGGVAYKNPLSEEFLAANQNLVLDTALFDADFKHRLMASIDDLDERTDGLLIHGDNFHALNLLQEGYREQIKCIYIDPPYNTGNDGFNYRDNYQHSSWLSMMENRLELGRELLGEDGMNFTSIGDDEISNLNIVYKNIFGDLNFITTITRIAKSGGNKGELYKPKKDYILFACKDKSSINKLDYGLDDTREYNWLLEEFKGEKRKFFKGEMPYREKLDARPNQRYYIQAPDGSLIIPKGNVFPKKKEDSATVFPLSNEDNCWTWSVARYLEEKENDRFIFQKSEKSPFLDEYGKKSNWTVYKKIFEEDVEGRKIILSDILSGCENSLGTKEMDSLSLSFSYPKSSKLVEHLVKHVSQKNATILDYFAGSGTTGHAVINLNREDGGKRKYILVEMGEYFETVTKPRIQKVIYAKDWKDGKPNPLGGTRTDAPAQNSHCFKTIRLESYEDALNNLKFIPIEDQTSSPPPNAPVFEKPEHYEQYLLSYMLDMESRGSAMNLDIFKNPFKYKMKITTHNQESVTPVDLVETFNYLIGLRVAHIAAPQYFNAQTKPDKDGRVNANLTVASAGADFAFQRLEGKTRNDELVLVIWRTLTGDVERDNAALNEYLCRLKINTREHEFDVIYVNGDNTLPNIRKENENWKVQLIEQVFFDKMFGGAR